MTERGKAPKRAPRERTPPKLAEAPPPRDGRLFVGIDWGSCSHRVRALDVDQRLVWEEEIEHSRAGMERLLELLPPPGACVIGIEDGRHPFADHLARARHKVMVGSPERLDALSGIDGPERDDIRDADLIGRALIIAPRIYRDVVPDDERTAEIREALAEERDVRKLLRQDANRLRQILERTTPSLLDLCPGADMRWLWTLVAETTDPDDAAARGEKLMRGSVRDGVLRKATVAKVAEALDQPPLFAPEWYGRIAWSRARLTAMRLLLEWRQAQDAEAKVLRMIEAWIGPQAAIMMSAPGLGPGIAAVLLVHGNIGRSEARFRQLRLYAGQGPVTVRTGRSRSLTRAQKRSGKTKAAPGSIEIRQRLGCNRAVRDAMFAWVLGACRLSPAVKDAWDIQRSRSLKKGHAVRVVGDRLLRCLCAMLRTGTPWSEERYREVTLGDMSRAKSNVTPFVR